jgi:hypothetical protein
MLEGTLLGLMYILIFSAAILGLYVLVLSIIWLYKKCKCSNNLQENLGQRPDDSHHQDTLNDSLL